jgi:argininosuccinate lyase
VPFRQAHQQVGRLVAQAEKGKLPLAKLPLETLRSACQKIGPDVYRHLGAENVVKRYRTEGAAGAKQLRKQLNFWSKKLASHA